MCNNIELILDWCGIYTFSTSFHCLPCLAHVLHLTIEDIMSLITQITTAETTLAICEFDPSLPSNLIAGSLNVISALRTLVVKIHASGQWIAYFEHLQAECNIEKALSIPLHSKIRWGTAEGMLTHAYRLRQVCFNILNTYHRLIKS